MISVRPRISLRERQRGLAGIGVPGLDARCCDALPARPVRMRGWQTATAADSRTRTPERVPAALAASRRRCSGGRRWRRRRWGRRRAGGRRLMRHARRRNRRRERRRDCARRDGWCGVMVIGTDRQRDRRADRERCHRSRRERRRNPAAARGGDVDHVANGLDLVARRLSHTK